MLEKAVDLLAGAILLHQERNDHAALFLAIHSGTNSADAINEFYGEPFTGDHRKAPDHLRRWDPERLSDAARWLRRLVDMKATAEYREKRYTARTTADAIALSYNQHSDVHLGTACFKRTTTPTTDFSHRKTAPVQSKGTRWETNVTPRVS